jgi:hypothetical protein
LYTTRPKAKVNADQVLGLERVFYGLVKQLKDQFEEIRKSEESVQLSKAQEDLRNLIESHLKKEREAGQKIRPALPLQILTEVNSSNCGIAEKRVWYPSSGAGISANISGLVCRELEALSEATVSCVRPGTSSQSLAW